jgi:transposase
MGRRKFTKEFKRDAVSLIETSGKSLSQIARELGLQSSVLSAWREMVSSERKSGLGTDEQEELKRLRRDNDRLKMEVEILKKATAFFARESK